MNEYEVMVRLGLALLLGLCIGVERTFARKQAGLRTFGLVSLGAALFVMISQEVVLGLGQHGDAVRVLAGIVTGVGFIGAGMIIFQKDSLTNLTTAAGIWVSAAIGGAVGYGMHYVAVVATVLVIITYAFLWKFEELLRKKLGKREKNTHEE